MHVHVHVVYCMASLEKHNWSLAESCLVFVCALELRREVLSAVLLLEPVPQTCIVVLRVLCCQLLPYSARQA